MFMLKYALENPVKVLVAVLFVFLFGVQALLDMPYQLSPSVVYPTISVRTSWSGATPYEVEREIVEPQENVLKSLAGLLDMESQAGNGSGNVRLQFELGTDLMEAMLLVSNKLNEVRSYPDNVNKPVIRASGADDDEIVLMTFEILPGNENGIDSYRSYVSEEVVPRFERVDGVGEVFFYGGRATQMHITVFPEKLAAYNINIGQLSNVLNQQNVNVSAGTLPVGRKNYRVRTVAEYTSVDDIKNTIIMPDYGGVKVADVADVAYGYSISDAAIKYGEERTMIMGVIAETGANVLDVTNDVEQVFNEVNEEMLAAEGLRLHWIYDQRPYINGAIDLVKGNIVVGGILAVLVLLLFLRRAASTLIVFIAIPISIIGTFIILNGLGRTLNVISLAGIAFSVGILVDTAIVVLENIDRHMKLGKPPWNAALEGVNEVWGAVLASTLTTIAVFLPVVFIQQEAGQLFRDIAIAISSSVILSLLVSVLVIPVLTKLIYGRMKAHEPGRFSVGIGEFGTIFTEAIMRLSLWINISAKRKLATIGIFMAFSALSVLVLLPKMEYLPQGNMNMVRSNFNLPSGLSLEERQELADIFYQEVKPHIGAEIDGQPAIAEFIYNVNPGGMSATSIATDPERAIDLVPMLSGLMRKVPGVTGSTSQTGIFQGGGGRSFNIAVSGEDLDELIEVSRRMMALVREAIPDAQVRPRPSLEMLYPEATFYPQYQQLGDAHLSPENLGITVDTFVDGRKIGEFRDADLGNIDMMLTYPVAAIDSPEDIGTLPIAVTGGVVPISNVAQLELGFGMDGIRRYERERTFTLTVSPPAEMVLEEVMNIVSTRVVEPLQAEGVLEGIEVRYTGSASKLVEARDVLAGNFLLALIITFLLMAALFNNFFYPLIIMFSVPLALAGGFIGLALVNLFIAYQPLDILTMLGFVILVGVVVNNAILIVHQALNNIRMYGMAVDDAITESVRSRLRPIFMGAATSLFGMLPLVVFPGAGSELYRGLGSVVLGGLTVSTMFTVFLVPALLSLTLNFRRKPRY